MPDAGDPDEATTLQQAALAGRRLPPTDGRVAALIALGATAPLQLVIAVLGFLARDAVAATGMGILSGTWAVVRLTTLTSPPGATGRRRPQPPRGA